MRVVVPWSSPAPYRDLVALAIRQQGIDPELTQTDDGSGYHDLLVRESARGKFIIIEHDVIVWPGLLQQMWACSSKWCTVPMMIGGRFSPFTFGCVKFDDPGISFQDFNPRWQSQDRQFLQAAFAIGIAPCVHTPAVTHLGERHQPSVEVLGRVSMVKSISAGVGRTDDLVLWEAD